MKVRPAFAAVAVTCLFGPSRLPADEVIHWNNVMLDSIRTNSMSPLPASRILAAMNTGMYDAVNSIARTHQPYHVNMTADPVTRPIQHCSILGRSGGHVHTPLGTGT